MFEEGFYGNKSRYKLTEGWEKGDACQICRHFSTLGPRLGVEPSDGCVSCSHGNSANSPHR